jgi:branched-chain amino acid transport system substrate-binding protein
VNVLPAGGRVRSALRRLRIAGAAASAMLVAACSGFPGGDLFSFGSSNPSPPPPPAQAAQTVGAGATKVALILPLSATGNAGLAALSMKNAAEMALAEFSNPNIQLLIKDDAGTAQGAQQATQDALAEGVDIILGPLFAHTVSAAGASARARGIPMIAFSTDANVAAHGVYLLSFLPESDVDRVVDYATANGKRSFAGLVQDNPYGSVVEAEFQQAVARKGGRVIALERYPSDKAQMQESVRGAVGDQGASRRRRGGKTRAADRHRPVGRPAHLRRSLDAGRLVRGAGRGGLPQLLQPLSHQVRPGSGAHGHPRL